MNYQDAIVAAAQELVSAEQAYLFAKSEATAGKNSDLLGVANLLLVRDNAYNKLWWVLEARKHGWDLNHYKRQEKAHD